MKNKIYAIAILTIGIVAMKLENDGTFLLLASFLAVPMFFSKKDWIF